MSLDPAVRVGIGFVAGALAGAAAWRATRDTFALPLFRRQNYRGHHLPVGVGVLLPVVLIVVVAIASVADAMADGAPVFEHGAMHVLALCAGFSLLGLVDDVAASGDERGFTGHLRAMAQGTLTTGGLKLTVGGALALVVAAPVVHGAWWHVLLGGAVISLAANLGNLFDRAPGRCTKVGLLGGVAVVGVAAAQDELAPLVAVVVVLGAAAGLLRADLREELMLGDAGSNVIGAVLGWAVVATCGTVAQLVVAAALVGLNALSERVSFSAVIDAVAPLRALDRLGRRPTESPPNR